MSRRAGHGPRRQRLKSVAALATVTLLLAGCPDPQVDGGGGGRTEFGPLPATEGRPHPLGFKWDLPRLERHGDYLRQVAGGATFAEVVWCLVEPRPGAQNWSVPDRAVETARQLGHEINLKLRTGSCWVNGDRGGQERGRNERRTASAFPDDVEAYAAWVARVVDRYPDVQRFAVENEVNSPSMWSGSPDEYRELATVASTAIRASRAMAIVLDSGTSSAAYGVAVARQVLDRGDSGGAMEAYNRYYMRRFASRAEFPRVRSAGALRAVLAGELPQRHLAFFDTAVALARAGVTDGLQVHFYEPADAAADLVTLLAAHVPDGARVEAWEVGLFWPEAPAAPAEVAGEVARSVATLLAGGVERVIWLPFAHNPDGRRAEEVRLGVVDGGTGAVRPVGRALATVAAALAEAGPAPVRAPSNGNGSRGLVMEGSGAVAAVLWADRRAELRLPAGARVTDALGVPIPAGGRVVLTAEPVIVTAPPGTRF